LDYTDHRLQSPADKQRAMLPQTAAMIKPVDVYQFMGTGGKERCQALLLKPAI
jgi:hypothetical protein